MLGSGLSGDEHWPFQGRFLPKLLCLGSSLIYDEPVGAVDGHGLGGRFLHQVGLTECADTWARVHSSQPDLAQKCMTHPFLR